MSGPKKVWNGQPVRKVEKFIEVRMPVSHKLAHIAVLECGHGVFRPRKSLEGESRVQRHGLTCDVCQPVEAPKPKLAVVAPPAPGPDFSSIEAKLNTLLGGVMNISKKLKDVDDRLTQVEDAKTAPVAKADENA